MENQTLLLHEWTVDQLNLPLFIDVTVIDVTVVEIDHQEYNWQIYSCWFHQRLRCSLMLSVDSLGQLLILSWQPLNKQSIKLAG